MFRHALVRVADSPVAGRGVFAVTALAEGQVAEVAPVLLLHRIEGDQSGTLARYVFEWDTDADDTAYALALGWGSLFNHSGTPTCQYLRADDDETIAGLLGEPYDPAVHGNLAPALVFVMNRAAAPGEELTIDYSGVGDGDFVFPD